MSKEIQQQTRNELKSFFENDNVKNKFKEILGKKSTGFIASVLQIASQNSMLAKAEPMSVFQAAATAATLDLPLNNNLGFAYIIPYNRKQQDGSFKCEAQFQLGYKGFIQLAQRSGQFQTISSTPIYEGQIASNNPLTGIEFDFDARKGNSVIGYAAYFSLLNGFEKTLFMTTDEMQQHGQKYSKTYGKSYGMWQKDFHSMSCKTVLKQLLSKYAPLSIEMQRAVITDQAVINDFETEDVSYIDNEVIEIDKEAERVRLMLEQCETVEDLEMLENSVIPEDEEVIEMFDNKKKELKKKKK